jgi:hypothetical protein
MSEKTIESSEKAIESPRHNYLVVGHYQVQNLVTEVGDLINRGWTCQGGITAAYETSKNVMWFYQAMIKN